MIKNKKNGYKTKKNLIKIKLKQRGPFENKTIAIKVPIINVRRQLGTKTGNIPDPKILRLGADPFANECKLHS